MTEIKDQIFLSVPGRPDCAIVLRTALGGAGVIYDLDLDRMDDLMAAADECMDLLTHQSRAAQCVTMSCFLEDCCLKTVFTAVWAERENEGEPLSHEMSQAILETLIPQVSLEVDASGVKAVTLLQPLNNY